MFMGTGKSPTFSPVILGWEGCLEAPAVPGTTRAPQINPSPSPAFAAPKCGHSAPWSTR